jgi:hypothetical protein
MALPVLDGNQSATTLSSVVTGGEHIVAHTVVSLGSTAISNITSAVSGSVVSISNFPASQTIAGTVTANLIGRDGTGLGFDRRIACDSSGNTIVNIHAGDGSGPISNVNGLLVRGTVTANVPFASTTATFPNQIVAIGYRDGLVGNTIKEVNNDNGELPVKIQKIDAGGALNSQFASWIVDSGGDVPISGTVTANVFGQHQTDEDQRPIPVDSWQIARADTTVDLIVPVQITNDSGTLNASNPLPISGTVTANVAGNLNSTLEYDGNTFFVKVAGRSAGGKTDYPINISGTVTVGNSVTIGSLPSISGTVTANINGTVPVSISSVTIGNSVTIGSFATSVTARLINPAGTAVTYAEVGTAGNPSIDVLSVQGVSGGTNLPIAGSVTISGVPSGALTTRFGSVVTANTALLTAAVTNSARRYLLIQNVTTSSNVITVGVGFTPTTTQGIQLTAGAGITFESSYIPTGAVYILSSVTASTFTILEA